MFVHFLFYLLGITTFNLYTLILFNYERFFDRSIPANISYDFIVVGSGSSGSIVASSLNGKVLLIEAGSKGDSFPLNVPILQPLLQKSSFDWSFETSSQENACGAFKNRRIFCPLGKIFGGSHRLNNMVYHPGHHSDYEFLIRKEDAHRYFKENEETVSISRGNFVTTIGEAFIEAGEELGLIDFSYTNLTHYKGRRATQIDYLKAMKERREICLNSDAVRVIFDADNPNRAVGVEYEKHGTLHQVFGRKIILSAGAIGSPKILLQSGIGPKEHLEEIGIKCRENLPVGENLQDHVSTGLDLIIVNQTIGFSVKDFVNPFKLLDYFLFDGDGSPFAFAGSDAMGFAKLNQSSDAPDLSFMLLPVGLVKDHGLHLRKIMNLRDDIWEQYFKPLIGQTTITILPILLHPKSRGTVRLRSDNFRDPPIINPNYLSDNEDIKKLIAGIRILEKIVETSSMQKFGAEFNPKPFPGCEKFFFDSNDYWECYIRHMTLTMFHPVGTCRIGDLEDKSTVVLKNFQVKNFENLFVVDGSVLPRATTANPHAIIAMLTRKFVHDLNLLK